MQLRTWWGGALAAVLAFAGAGCGGGENQPVPVRGVVKLDGNPIEGAMVTFFPDDNKGRAANGLTGPDGSFQLTTAKPNDGAMPGSYKVVVSYQEGTVDVSGTKGQKEAFELIQKGPGPKRKPPKYVIPARYSDPGKTTLKEQVPTKGTVTLDLQSK